MVIAIMASLLTLVLAVVAIVCWVKVLVLMFKTHVGLGILGILFTPFAFVYGWVKAKTCKIVGLMILWTVCSGLMFVSVMFVSAVAMLLPAVSGATSRAQMVRTSSNGRQICMAVHAENAEREAINLPLRWPMTTGEHRAASSTEYFRTLMADDIVFGPVIFEAPGLPTAQNADPGSLRNENIAWCTVAYPQERKDWVPDTTPFLFTRNLEIDVLNGSVSLRLTDAAPFGTKGAVVITRGGACRILRGEDLRDYAQTLDSANLTNVLRP